MTSQAELTLAVQLEQAGIPFEREYRFHPIRRWRSDLAIVGTFDIRMGKNIWWGVRARILVEIDGGGFIQGHHSRGKGIEDDAEKQSAAAILEYRVIRVTPAQVDDGRALHWIRQALGIEEAA